MEKWTFENSVGWFSPQPHLNRVNCSRRVLNSTLPEIWLKSLQSPRDEQLFIHTFISGLLHIDDCTAQPLLPVWHVVAGSTGLVVPLLYLLFDDLNPALAKTCPGIDLDLDIFIERHKSAHPILIQCLLINLKTLSISLGFSKIKITILIHKYLRIRAFLSIYFQTAIIKKLHLPLGNRS